MSVMNPETLIKKDRYRQLYKNFTWKVPKYYNFGFDVVDQWAEDRTKLALISIDRSGENAHYHTFFDLKVQSNQFANVLRRIGIKKGDRVLVILQSIPQWYIALIGMFKLGVVPMPGTVLLTSKDIEYRVNRAEACMLVTDIDHADRVEAIKHNCPTLKHLMLVDSKRKGWMNFNEEMSKTSRELTQKEIGKTLASDPMLIYFTSGTTGHPKMVLHTHSYP
ncbi:MAG: AMP-binding protein, partial [Petrotogales bacterium]